MLTDRLKSSIPLIILICLAFFLPFPYGHGLFVIMALAMLWLACHEMFELLDPPKKPIIKAIAILYGTITIATISIPHFINKAPIIGIPDSLVLALAVLAVFTISLKVEPTKANVNGSLAAIGAIVAIPWTLAFIPRLVFLTTTGDTRPLVFYMILVTKIADAGAYAAGTWTAKRPGRNHKLSPLISPKKSWEGFIGGTISSAVTALACYLIFPATVSLSGTKIFTWMEALAFGILASVIGLIGDLAESSIKRSAKAKDSGALPGIGGILDTLDSLLFVSPLFYAFVQYKLN